MRNLLPLLIITSAISAISAVQSPAAQPPNVLFIAIDDLNDWVSPHRGNDQSITPNLEKFADSGAVVFQNAHCAGPVCGPSRSALLSGFMQHRSGVYGNSQNMRDSRLIQEHATLPEYFSKNGYHSLSMGKIYHAHTTAEGRDSGQWAFDEWHNTVGGSPPDKNHITSRDKNLIDGQPGPPSKNTKSGGSEFAWGPTVGPRETTSDYQTALWAAEQLASGHEKPLFLAVGISKPHLPFHVPQEFFDLYDRDKIHAPEIPADDLADIRTPAGKQKFFPTPDSLWLEENGLLREASRAYLAASSYADACLGVIFEALAKSPDYANTIVIVWGDHGWHLGEKMRFRKSTGWSESTRVPLYIRLPNMTGRADCDRPVNLIDLYPTLIDLCSLTAKPEIDGRSLAPLLEKPDLQWDHASLTIFGEGNASVTDGRWRLVRHNDKTEELYNLAADPMEWKNLSNEPTPEAGAARERLLAFLPKEFAPGIPDQPSVEKDRLKTTKGLGIDATIKATRPLSTLR